jgi:hypothetical protein
MSFDAIPVVTLDGGRSDRLDLSNRRFDPSKLEEAGRASGKNIRKQIEFFLSEKTQAKPYLIAQGNCYDSYMKWIEYIKDELPADYIQHIGGIAMGAAALGKGTLEDIKRAFYFTQLPIDIPNRNMHLLGVGSINRMVPNVVFVQNGLYDGVKISYDSTTHTIGGPIWGRYYKSEGDTYEITRSFTNTYTQILADIQKNFPGVYETDVQSFFEAMNTPTREYQKKHGSADFAIQSFMIFCASTIKNFVAQLDEVSHDRKKLLQLVKPSNRNYVNSLYNVKSVSDFDHWMKHISRFVDSEPVEVLSPRASLEDFFA